MGSLGMSSCSTNYGGPAPAPNPNPKRWSLVSLWEFDRAHVILAKYLDCTNFEGNKIMVYKGKYKASEMRDPHFAVSDESPIARYKPTEEGLRLALICAAAIPADGGAK